MASSPPNNKHFDIAEVIEHYTDVTVPDRGSGWVKISCPTGEHEDRTPSCTVNRTTGRLKCFSCDFSGDAVDLIQLKEGLDFVGAVEFGEKIFSRSSTEVPRAAEKPGRRPTARISDQGAALQSGDHRPVSAGSRRKPRRLG